MSLGKKILMALIATVALAVMGFFVLRRADIADPAVLANMPVEDLRNAEVETLLRAAFRNARKVTITTEMPENQPLRTVVVEDQTTLNELADIFYVGRDQVRPGFRHPGTTYVQVEIDGPYRPDFNFMDTLHIHFRSGPRWVPVPGKFVVKLGEILKL